MKKIFLIMIAGVILLMPAFVLASDFGTENLGKAAGTSYDNKDINTSVANIISAVLGLAGTIFLVLMVYGGITWMTAMGNSDKIDKAKEIIIAAVIGAAITASAYAITYFVMAKVSGGAKTAGSDAVFCCVEAEGVKNCSSQINNDACTQTGGSQVDSCDSCK